MLTTEREHKEAPEFVGLRIAPKAKRDLQRIADGQGVSLNGLLRNLLEARATGDPDHVVLANSRLRRVGQVSLRRLIESSTSAASQLASHLAALKGLHLELSSDLSPDAETQKQMAELLQQMAVCENRLSEGREMVLSLAPEHRAGAGDTNDQLSAEAATNHNDVSHAPSPGVSEGPAATGPEKAQEDEGAGGKEPQNGSKRNGLDILFGR